MAGEKPSGSINRKTTSAVSRTSGGISPGAGALAKKLKRALAGALSSIVGGTTRIWKKSLGGSLAPAGSVLVGLAVRLLVTLRDLFLTVRARGSGTTNVGGIELGHLLMNTGDHVLQSDGTSLIIITETGYSVRVSTTVRDTGLTVAERGI